PARSARRSSRFDAVAAAGRSPEAVTTTIYLHSFCRPPVDEQAADEGEYQLARLVGPLVEGEHQPLVGPARHRARLDDLARERDGIARVDGLDPFELAEAGRRAGAADRLAARAHRLLLAQPILDDEPDADRAGMPARRHQAAEMPAHRGVLVDMERLWIEAPGERLDLLRREGMAAEVGLLADGNVLEILHAPLLFRRPNMLTFSWVINSSPA